MDFLWRLSFGLAPDLSQDFRTVVIFDIVDPFGFLVTDQFDLCFEVVGSHTLNFRSFRTLASKSPNRVCHQLSHWTHKSQGS